MSSTNLTGKTPVETLKNELGWLAGWAIKLLRVAKDQNRMFGVISAQHNARFGAEQIDPVTTMDSMAAIADGGASLGSAFEFGKYRDPNAPEQCLHQSLMKSFIDLHAQASGKVPIPTGAVHMRNIVPNSEISKEDGAEFDNAFNQIVSSVNVMNQILEKYFTDALDTSVVDNTEPQTPLSTPHLYLKMKLVDACDCDVNPVGLNVEDLVKKLNAK